MATYTIDNIPSNLKNGDVINCDYSGTVKSCVLPPGQYKFECWGASGGYFSGYTAGKGGYSIGTVIINNKSNVFVYVGGCGKYYGESGYNTSGFNGGGHPITTSGYSCTGGGASDIRIGQDSLYARVIVAGGGGSNSHYSSNQSQGANGYGGGLNGGSISSGSAANCAYGLGGSQTAGGYTGSNGVSPNETYRGGFGYGGYGTGSDSDGYGNAGGGGGWYGGGGGNASAAGGGSGYVYTSSTASNYPSGCLLNPSYYLTDAQTIAGNQQFPSPSGTSETGHTGNGYVRITVLSSYAASLFAKVSNEWKKINKSYIKIGSEWWLINSAYEKNKQTQKWRSIL